MRVAYLRNLRGLKYSILSCLLATLCLFSSQTFSASAINKMIVFGDSLSDNGNLYNLSNHTMPISPPYYEGHFSNGPVWVEYLAQSMQLDPGSKDQVSNYAFAGAWAEDIIPSGALALATLSWEISEYIKLESTHGFDSDKQLVILWAGANDYLNGRLETSVDDASNKTVEAIRENLELLIQDGARKLLVLNLPDLGLAPKVKAEGREFASRVSELAFLHNQKLADMLAALRIAHPNVTILDFDVPPYLNDLISHPEKYHLSNVIDPCYTGGYEEEEDNTINGPHLLTPRLIGACKTPNTYVYWDTIHPTTIIHQILAGFVYREIENKA